MDEDGAVVGGVPEVGDFLRVPDGCGVVVANHSSIKNVSSQSRSDIEEVDARLAARSADELLGMGVVDEVDVWCLLEDEVVNEETG